MQVVPQKSWEKTDEGWKAKHEDFCFSHSEFQNESLRKEFL